MSDEAGPGTVKLLERQFDTDVAATLAIVHRRNGPSQLGSLLVVIRVVVAPVRGQLLHNVSKPDSLRSAASRRTVIGGQEAGCRWWEARLGRALPDGTFGENLTTVGLDISGARLGEQWRVGRELVLSVTGPRINCSTFAVWMGTRGWLNAFTARARPGAYFRVITPGEVRAGDAIEVVHRPVHAVEVGLTFRALTRERSLLPRLLSAGDDLEPELRDLALAGRGFELDDEPQDRAD